MRSRWFAAVLAALFALAACATAACAGAHIGHDCEGPACEICPILLGTLRLFGGAVLVTAFAAAASAVREAVDRPRACGVPSARRTPVLDRVQMND